MYMSMFDVFTHIRNTGHSKQDGNVSFFSSAKIDTIFPLVSFIFLNNTSCVP